MTKICINSYVMYVRYIPYFSKSLNLASGVIRALPERYQNVTLAVGPKVPVGW